MWAPAGHDAPAGLLDGLRQRGVAVREVSSAPEAMATIGLAGEGGEGAAVNVVVIVEPGAIRDAGALVRAIRMYHRGVGVWRYQRGERHRLERWPDEGGAEAPAARAASAGAGGPQGTRGAGAWSSAGALEPQPRPSRKADGNGADHGAAAAGGAAAPAPGGVWRGGDIDGVADGGAEGGAGGSIDDEARPLLTDEELAMLLGEEEPGEDRPGEGDRE